MYGQWRIECFGSLRGTLGETVVNRFRTRRAALLLAYLAVHQNRSHPRAELAVMLWPEADDEAMRARLRLALASLRRQFEPPFLPRGSVFLVTGDSLQLSPSMVVSDVGEFEQVVQAARKANGESQRDNLERAAALYRGEFLAGYEEEWVLAERTRLAEIYTGVLSQLIVVCAAEGKPDQVLNYGRKLLVVDPWQEAIHCQVMRANLDQGNGRAALRQYEQLKSALEELGEEPSEEARSLADQARVMPSLTVALRWTPPPIEQAVVPSISGRPHLPVRLTRFFGRTEELVHVKRWIEEGPGQLVTLTGFGGSGKSRLSIEAGYAMAEEGWTVWFVPLADVSSSVRIYDAILTNLKVAKQEDLGPYLRSIAKPLIILDNLEHLMDDAADYVARLLADVPNLRCLATSRQKLMLEGERELTVSPLMTPSADELTLERAASLPGVQLYIDRCQSIRPDFQLSAGNVAPIISLCQRLEGIPLAIEIAASLSRSLSPSQLAERLENRLHVLVSPRRDISDRQRTLRNTIAYSYDLLTPALAKLFLNLSVFRGGWTIESAEAICAGDHAFEGESLLVLLSQLRERSLIETFETRSGEMRFRMLEAFREFAKEQMPEAEQDQLAKTRDEYFMRLSRNAFENMGTTKEYASLAVVQSEYDNFVHVMEGALAREDAQFGLQFAIGFGQVWRSRGAVVHERSLIEGLVNLDQTPTLDPELQMRGLNLASHASFLLCDWDRSLAAEKRTLEIAEREGSDEFMAVGLGGTSLVLLGKRQRKEAFETLQKALVYARRTGKDRRISLLLGNLGVVAWQVGDLVQAEAYFREALSLAHKLESDSQANHLRLNISRVLIDSGRVEEAMETLPACVDRAAQLHRAHDAVMGLSLLARAFRLTGEIDRAWALTQVAMQRVFSLMNEIFELYVSIEAGLELVALARFREAAVLLTSVSKQDLAAGDKKDTENALNECRTNLGTKEFDKAWAKGMSQSVADSLRSLRDT